ncbi:DNA mismatch repair protein MutS [Paenibacillus shunpengii]|uniref:DNA mismatch repair protein MutS n=1 Tax=Paenibacillus shunpengii TaxID=2054424 RepID=A0ABW5SWR2_9BACL
MNHQSMQRLEYSTVKEQLRSYAVSYLGERQIDSLTPMTRLTQIRQALAETEEALGLIRHGASVPLPSLSGIENIMNLLGTGYLFTEQDFMHLLQFLRSCTQLMKYMQSKREIAPNISAYAGSMYTLDSLREEVERCIYLGRITDHASKELLKTRKQAQVIEERLKKKLDTLLSKHRSILQDQLITKRGDRYCLPVQKEFRKQIRGTVHGESASGQTVFIEPDEIASLQMELSLHRAAEQREEMKILSELTRLADQAEYELRVNTDTVGIYDFLFAKARYALSYQGRSVHLVDHGVIRLRSARHPLVNNMVPLDFHIGDAFKSLIITGPNTGGKTLCLKTIGLLTLMAQSGLLVPVGEDSQLSVFEQVAVDIGDGQSIEHQLSTFSAHIKNIIEILKIADPSTLILIDEMASGTDPGEGTGLSIALLEEMHRRQATVVATTHFSEIKNFAASADGFENARMEFDTESLKPLYRLTIGEAGNSYAYAIALKLGIPPYIIERSKQISATSLTAIADSSGEPKAADSEEKRNIVYRNTNSHEPIPDHTKRVDDDRRGSRAAHAKRAEPTDMETQPARPLQIGDRVHIPYMQEGGIIVEAEDPKGKLTVLVRGKKLKIAKQRVKLHIAGEELYPDDYDFDVVSQTKENRKKRKQMSKKHVPGLTIEMPRDES